MTNTEEVTPQLIRQIQAEHKRNLHLSAASIGDRLSIDLKPVTIVKIIEGDFNKLLEDSK